VSCHERVVSAFSLHDSHRPIVMRSTGYRTSSTRIAARPPQAVHCRNPYLHPSSRSVAAPSVHGRRMVSDMALLTVRRWMIDTATAGLQQVIDAPVQDVRSHRHGAAWPTSLGAAAPRSTSGRSGGQCMQRFSIGSICLLTAFALHHLQKLRSPSCPELKSR
jgi:hypothetical protein